jgi:fatty acid/phospholipid synthesis protein PlsX
MSNYTIAIDAMGGDHAPDAIVQGAILALDRFDDIHIQLYGPTDALKPLITAHSDRITLCDAPDVIAMDEAPVLAIRRKVNSSMVQGMLAVKENRASAIVSAGSTGALLAGGMLRIGRIEGIERPALTVVMPGRKKPFVMLDCGANVDCQPSYLSAFGLMGSVYSNKLLGVADPEVRIVNVGAEDEKGNKLTKSAAECMREQNVYRFGGNVEGRDIPEGVCDVVVADGFDGNLLLKYTEGLSSTLFSMIKEALTGGGLLSKIGALLIKPTLRTFKKKLSYEEYGGAPLLGVKGIVIKAHGSSDARAIMNAIGQARTMIISNVVALIEEGAKRLSSPSETNNNQEEV